MTGPSGGKARHLDLGWLLMSVFGTVTILLLIAPLLVIVLVSVNPEHIVLPPEGFSLRWYRQLPFEEKFIRAFWLSLRLGAVAAAVSTMVGIPSAVALVRYEFTGKRLVMTLLMSPILVPAVIAGLALYQYLFVLGLGRSFLSLALGHIVITLPFPLRTLTASLQGLDPALEEAAIMLGETPMRAFLKVTLPLAKMGVVGGAALSFLVSWNNFPLSVFLSTVELSPLPVEIFNYLQWQFKPVIAAVSAVTILFSVVLIFMVERFVGLSAVMTQSA